MVEVPIEILEELVKRYPKPACTNCGLPATRKLILDPAVDDWNGPFLCDTCTKEGSTKYHWHNKVDYGFKVLDSAPFARDVARTLREARASRVERIEPKTRYKRDPVI